MCICVAACSRGYFRCAAGGNCLPSYGRCDGGCNCPYCTDELNCYAPPYPNITTTTRQPLYATTTLPWVNTTPYTTRRTPNESKLAVVFPIQGATGPQKIVRTPLDHRVERVVRDATWVALIYNDLSNVQCTFVAVLLSRVEEV